VKIRNRIILWITGAGLLAGLLFSVFITYELIEQPYELLDGELDSQTHTLLSGLAPGDEDLVSQGDRSMLDSLGRLYWFKVFNQQQKLVYSSAMTGYVDLPLRKKSSGYNINTAISPDASALEQDDSNKVTFRVRVFTIPFAGQEYLVQIARPMEKLQEEIVDLIISITVGLVLYTIALLLFGYFVAGKILQPIADINTLAREISEKNLDIRIPLGSNQDELYKLSSSLNQMFDRLEFSFRQQKEFIANASHELKTPIAMQRLFLNEAQQRDDLPEKFTVRLDGQIKIIYRMDRLVKNLLDLSTLELNNSFESSAVNLTELATSVLLEYNEIIHTASIQLTADMQKNIQLQADEEKLRRMLINLVDNAIKYNSGKNKEIRFHLASENDHICIEIYNTGQGIPAEDLNQVFNQFFRVEKSRSTALGGSGLGLTIVKRIVELHHGSIEIGSEFGSWVRVRIFLPLKPDVIRDTMSRFYM
jgi:signal transduction histidine kinase